MTSGLTGAVRRWLRLDCSVPLCLNPGHLMRKWKGTGALSDGTTLSWNQRWHDLMLAKWLMSSLCSLKKIASTWERETLNPQMCIRTLYLRRHLHTSSSQPKPLWSWTSADSEFRTLQAALLTQASWRLQPCYHHFLSTLQATQPSLCPNVQYTENIPLP